MTWRERRNSKLHEWFLGDREAVQLLLTLSDITELWDDLIDNDKPISREQINAAFMRALIDLPTNPFFAQHKTYLMPLIIQSINSWQDANVLEQGDDNQRAIAYTLRNMDIQIAQAIAFIVGGFEHMRTVSVDMWDMFGARQDDIGTWLEETRK